MVGFAASLYTGQEKLGQTFGRKFFPQSLAQTVFLRYTKDMSLSLVHICGFNTQVMGDTVMPEKEALI
jgi:hypothetical protein